MSGQTSLPRNAALLLRLSVWLWATAANLVALVRAAARAAVRWVYSLLSPLFAPSRLSWALPSQPSPQPRPRPRHHWLQLPLWLSLRLPWTSATAALVAALNPNYHARCRVRRRRRRRRAPPPASAPTCIKKHAPCLSHRWSLEGLFAGPPAADAVADAAALAAALAAASLSAPAVAAAPSGFPFPTYSFERPDAAVPSHARTESDAAASVVPPGGDVPGGDCGDWTGSEAEEDAEDYDDEFDEDSTY